jgi:DNA-directed RNA polymerase specialized sigma subunit
VARKQYKRFVESMAGKEMESPLQNIFASTILGDIKFINEIRSRYLDIIEKDRNLPDVKIFHEKPDIGEIIDEIEKKIPEDMALLKRVQIYVCHRYSGQKLKDIGEYFGIGVSGVSQSSRRVAMQIDKDKKLKRRIDKILTELNLSTV